MNYKDSLVFFDDTCLMCNSFIRFILTKQKKAGSIFVTGLSGDKIKLIENFENFKGNTSTIYFFENGVLYTESKAIFKILQKMRPPVSWLSVLRFFPQFLTDAVYRLVARNRKKANNTCSFNPELSKYIV